MTIEKPNIKRVQLVARDPVSKTSRSTTVYGTDPQTLIEQVKNLLQPVNHNETPKAA